MEMPRAWGLLPIAFFAAYLAVAMIQDRGWDALWICHVANLMLGAGILARRSRCVRAAVLLLIPGIPLWIYDMAVAASVEPASIVSHVGGLLVGLVALTRMAPAPRAWPLALAVFLAAQLAARLLAPPSLNVNVAHATYPGWERWFASHGTYWIFTTAVAAALLWLGDRLLPRMSLLNLRPEATPP